MNQKGSTVVIILLVAVMLLMTGIFLYAVMRLPAPSQSNTSEQSPNGSTNSIEAPMATSRNCDNDTECLIQAVQNNCQVAKGSFEFTNTDQEIGLSGTLRADYEVRGIGVEAGKCAVYKHFGDVSYKVLDSAIQRMMTQGKLTRTQAEAAAQEQLNGLKALTSARWINTSDVCNFNVQDLTHDFEAVMKGEISVQTSIKTNLKTGTSTSGATKDVCHNIFR